MNNARQRRRLSDILREEDGIGLHELANREGYFHREYASEECKELCYELNVLVRNTNAKLPNQRENYNLGGNRSTVAVASDREDIPERRLWRRWLWRIWDRGRSQTPPVRNCCESLVAYQVPISGSEGQSWGDVDFVGISKAGAPVLIDLQAETDDPLHRILAQVLAYGIALRASCNFLREFRDVTKAKCSDDSPWSLVCMAPREYWRVTLGLCGPNGKMPEEFWRTFWGLVTCVENIGFSVHFVSLGGQVPDDKTDLSAHELDLCRPDILSVVQLRARNPFLFEEKFSPRSSYLFDKESSLLTVPERCHEILWELY